MASPRRLAYRDIFVWLLEQVVSAEFDDCDDFADRYVFPDMTTRVPLVLYLSQEEWTTLYSAVLTGADLSYPNTSHDVEMLFLQTVICSMSQLCEALALCILNNASTQAALSKYLADSGLTGGVGDPSAPISDGSLGENLLPAGYLCTDDKAFGMALAVVNALNDATTEVLQAIEIVTNPIEIAAELGDNIPGVGALASGGDVAAWIQDSAKEGYDLAWSSVVRDELACLLWCEFKQGCSLSFDTVWDVYMGASGVSPPPGVLLTDWLAWLILLPFTAALSTVATISLLGLLAMRYGGSFGDFQLGIRSMKTVIQLAADDSSPDWATLCDPCPTSWCYEWFNGSDDGAVAVEIDGCTAVVTTSRITGCSGMPGTAQWLGVRITFLTPVTITNVQMQTEMHATRSSSSDKCLLNINGTWVIDENTPEGIVTHNASGTWVNVDDIYIQCWAANTAVGPSPSSDGAYAYVNWVKLSGTGVNPMGADNC